MISAMIPMRVSASSNHAKNPLYEADRVKRSLLLVVDADTIDEDPNGIGVDDLLFGLMSHGEVDFYRYADAGAPKDAPLFDVEWAPPAAIGWLVASPANDPGITSHSLVYSNDDRRVSAALVSGLVQHFSKRISDEQGGKGSGNFEADSLLLLAASEIGADILLTSRPGLLKARPLNTPEPIGIATPVEAISLIGLYLRSRDEYFATKGERFAITYNRGLFWQEAVALHVGNLRDVLARCVMLDGARGTSTLAPLSFAVLRRLSRVFERRDSIWRLIDQKQDRDIAEDSLAALDSLLTFLMGASDALAQAATEILEATVNPVTVGWQNKTWLKDIATADPELSGLFAPRARPTQAMEVLRLLRNSVHAEGLDSVTVGTSNQIQEIWIRLPAATSKTVVAAMKSLRRLEKWGVHEGPDGAQYAELGPLLETLLLEVLNMFDVIANRLQVLLATIAPAPMPEPPSQVNEKLLALHIQWQLGLGDPWPEISPTTSAQS
jgi:hypothetical protein